MSPIGETTLPGESRILLRYDGMRVPDDNQLSITPHIDNRKEEA